MQKFEVGKQFPVPYRRQEGLTPVIDGTTLSFVLTISSPTKNEVAGIRKGLAKYGVAAIDDIPFIVWDFSQANITLDCYLNILCEPQEKQDAFFPELGNLLTIYLVDWQTGILHGIRVIGAEGAFMDAVKTTALNQVGRYKSANDVDMVAAQILAQYQTPDLMRRAKMYTARGAGT